MQILHFGHSPRLSRAPGNGRAGHYVLICLLVFSPLPAHADTGSRLLRLLSIPGVSGYEHAVREAIELSLPPGARVRADSLGNIVLRVSPGTPHTLVVAPLDEGGLVVSAITDGRIPARAPAHVGAGAAPLDAVPDRTTGRDQTRPQVSSCPG